MSVFYIYNEINFNTLQSFQHLLELERKQAQPHIDIYIDEANSHIFKSWIFHNFIQSFSKLYNYTFHTYLKRADTGGLLVFLAVPYNNRYLSEYVSAEYSLQINTSEDVLFEKNFINYLEKDKDFLHIGNYRDTIETIVNNSKLNYTNIAHLSEKNLDFKLMKKLGFADKSFYPFLYRQEKNSFAERILNSDKPVYNIPEHIQQEVEKLKKNQAEGIITKGELLKLLMNLIQDNL